MTCTIALTPTQRQWFLDHKDAWTIVNAGKDDITAENSQHANLVALLANMADFGKSSWQYAPGSTTHAVNALKGLHAVTDCGSLATMFQLMANNLGSTDAKRWHITPDDDKDRIVTEANLQCFNGQVGDTGIEGRWCFGDHWVVECGARSYDPTFNRTFDTTPVPPYFGWWGKYVFDATVYASSYFAADEHPAIYVGVVAGTSSRAFRPAIKARAGFCGIGRRAYQAAQPAVLPTPGRSFYTYRKTDRNGKEI